ncbi:MAG: MBL fold metallo-hydrolase [Solirubrobacterales bacterium]
MINEIYKNIFKIEIPLPDNPLRELHCYVIKSENRNLIIDTGFNTEECKRVLYNGLEEIGAKLNKTDLFVTHLHSDHCGLAKELSNKGSIVYTGKTDGELINLMCSNSYWDKYRDFIKLYDLEKDKVLIENHPGFKFCPKEPVDFITLTEGDVIAVGEYSLEVIDIPGHTPGHAGLYERKHKLFFCGDHILGKITPNISFWGFEQDILQVFFNSLNKVYDFEIDHLFTAHRDTVPNHKKRINELLEHHQERLKEITRIIQDEKKSVRDIASSMHWSVKGKSWVDFPDAQKCFASGETMSHLEHLYCTGKAERTLENGILYYKGI